MIWNKQNEKVKKWKRINDYKLDVFFSFMKIWESKQLDLLPGKLIGLIDVETKVISELGTKASRRF